MNSTHSNVSSALDGTKTLENLKTAFDNEAQSFTKAIIYSDLAKGENEAASSRTLSEIAENDKHHAELWLGYIDELQGTGENLEHLGDVSDALSSNVYPSMAEIAENEGFNEIAEKMRLVADVKQKHRNLLSEESERTNNPGTVYSSDPETLWLCTLCGYGVKGNTPPERCPLCSYPSNNYRRG